jgi:hypothetical protein
MMHIVTGAISFGLYLLIVVFFQLTSISMLLLHLILPGRVAFIDQALMLTRLLGITLTRHRDSAPVHSGKCFYFYNHRGWSDFFMDHVAARPCTNLATLGRIMVYWVCSSSLYCTFTRCRRHAPD